MSEMNAQKAAGIQYLIVCLIGRFPWSMVMNVM